MKLQKAVVNELCTIALGTAVGTAVMLLVFVLLGKFDYTVILGALLGYVAAVGNFFLMSLMVQKVTETEIPGETDDERNARVRRTVQLSYTQRRMFQALIVVAALILPYFNWVATVVVLAFPTVTVYMQQIIMNKRAAERTDKPNE